MHTSITYFKFTEMYELIDLIIDKQKRIVRVKPGSEVATSWKPCKYRKSYTATKRDDK